MDSFLVLFLVGSWLAGAVLLETTISKKGYTSVVKGVTNTISC